MIKKNWLNGNAGTFGRTMVIKSFHATKITGNNYA
jgi:hypothetical protein